MKFVAEYYSVYIKNTNPVGDPHVYHVWAVGKPHAAQLALERHMAEVDQWPDGAVELEVF